VVFQVFWVTKMIKNITSSFLVEISEYLKKQKSEESCGLVIQNGGKYSFLACENISIDKKNFFAVDPFLFAANDVVAVVHSHWQGSSFPSILDKKVSDDFDIPFLIYSIIDNDFCLYQNKSVNKIKV